VDGLLICVEVACQGFVQQGSDLFLSFVVMR